MESSRTKNSIKNAKSGLIVQLVNKVIAFVLRTVFIQTLNTEYLGINGLFTNILTLLSFAELGIGTAIIFSMYKPVASNDIAKIKSLMRLYRKAYNIIGVTIFLIGLAIMPFLPFLVKDVPNIKENINLIYLLFLINTVASYFFTYKKSIISAYQQERVTNYLTSIVKTVFSVIQMALLFLTHDFILYLAITILDTITENVVVSLKANKMFPFLKDKEVERLPKREVKKIFSDVKSLVVYKVGSIILDGTDNIIMSAMLNVATVGLVSNYTLIVSSIKGVLYNVLNSITASIGNLNTGSDTEKEERVLHQLTFANYFAYSVVGVCLTVLINPFIELWIGNDYLIPFSISIVLGLNLLIEGIRMPAYTYRVTLGLFKQGRMTPFIATVVNIVSSIVLCHFFGLIGIFIGTGLAQLCAYSWIDPYLIYKYEFKKSSKTYFKKVIVYFAVYALNVFICLRLSNLIDLGNGVLDIVTKAALVMVVSVLINVVLFRRMEEYREVKKKLVVSRKRDR